MSAAVCDDCGDLLQPQYERVYEFDYGTGFQCERCRSVDVAQERLDNMHPTKALMVKVTGRWR